MNAKSRWSEFLIAIYSIVKWENLFRFSRFPFLIALIVIWEELSKRKMFLLFWLVSSLRGERIFVWLSGDRWPVKTTKTAVVSLSFVLFVCFFTPLSPWMKNFFRDIAGERMAHALHPTTSRKRILYTIRFFNWMKFHTDRFEGKNIFAGWVVIICIYSRILTSLIWLGWSSSSNDETLNKIGVGSHSKSSIKRIVKSQPIFHL